MSAKKPVINTSSSKKQQNLINITDESSVASIGGLQNSGRKSKRGSVIGPNCKPNGDSSTKPREVEPATH